MKKFLLSAMALAMVSTVAYCGNNFDYQDVEDGEFYFNEEQFAGEVFDQIVTTFPLIYKGTLKLESIGGSYFDTTDISCTIGKKEKLSCTMYLAMCQGALSNTLCQNVVLPSRNPEAFTQIGAANYDPVYQDKEVAVAFGTGSTVPVVTSMKLYVVVSASDVKKVLAKIRKYEQVNGDEGYGEFLLQLFGGGDKSLVLSEDLMSIIDDDKSGFGSLDRKSVVFFTGAEKSGAILDFSIDSGSARDSKGDYNESVNSSRVQLVGKKGKYSFRYNPGDYVIEDITKDVSYRSGWKRQAGVKAKTAKFDCMKSFSGKANFYSFYDDYEDISSDMKVTEQFVSGTVKLTLNSITKTVARKIFGGDENNDLLRNPTICEEGLAFLGCTSMDDSDQNLNAFEAAVWGGKKANKFKVDQMLSDSAYGILGVVSAYFLPYEY